jgi:hypothetical protein
MKTNRQTLLQITAFVVIGLLGLDKLIVSPLLTRWKEGEERIDKLNTQINRGHDLLDRQQSIQDRWKEILHKNLSDDVSVAENDVFKAVARWTRDSRTAYSSLTPQWQNHDQNHEQPYKTLEMRASLAGDQHSLCRFLYELEVDPLPIRLEDCELSARDDKGRQLDLNVRFTALRLPNTERSGTR